MRKKFLIVLILVVGFANIVQSDWACAEIVQPVLKGDYDWKNIESEPFASVNFGRTTYKTFKKRYKYFKKEKLDSGEIILTNKSVKKPYNEIRVGFKEHKLDWIEFIFKDGQEFNDFMSLYGTAKNINKAHSTFYNYHNYGYYNVATDKQDKKFYSITLFKVPELSAKYNELNELIPSVDNLNFPNIFVPGTYLEMDFAQDYSAYFPKINNDGTKTYTIKNNVLKKYKKAELVFRNGILNFISLYPHNNKISLEQIVDAYGMVEKVYSVGNKVMYEYKNFCVVTDSKDNVINIGIFSNL